MQRIVLWGHHLDEYVDMFDLPESALTMRFLEYHSGPSAFQAELREQAAHLVSYDPWFFMDKTALTPLILHSFETRVEQIKARRDEFDFSRYGDTPETLIDYRRAGIDQFLKDYDLGHAEGRYLPIPEQPLPFEDFFYDFALSAHHFFSTMVPQTVEYHAQCIQELARVAKEVRIFPLVDADGIPSPLLGPVLLALQQLNYGVELREVRYHLQPRGNAMLRVWAQSCEV